MLHVLGCIAYNHDPRLVAIAAFLCGFSCWTTATLVSRIRADGAVTDNTGPRHLWTVAAALIFGSGVWATHFVAMLAFRSGFPVSYDPAWTIASIAVAIGFSGAAFALMFRRNLCIFSGIVLGIGISAMHYAGMRGLRGNFDMAWDYSYVFFSLLVGIPPAIAATAILRRASGLRAMVAASLLLSLSICAMHFTGMSAVTLIPDPAVNFDGLAVPPGALAVAVTAIAVLIVALGQISALLDRHLAALRGGETARQRAYIAELEATRRKLAGALDEANAANETKSAFLAAMSHELRTPLNAILGFSEMMQCGVFGPLGDTRYGDYVGDIHRSGAHLLSLINDVLDLSRLDAGKFELREDTFSLVDLAADTCRGMLPLARRGGLSLRQEMAANLPALHADERRVKQVLLNLLSNAIKFTPQGGAVTVHAWEEGGGLLLEVSDTGIGISADDMPRALERFGQVDSRLARKYEGTGLGLPLTRQLVELHGGKLALRSQPGNGTAVTIFFPAERLVRPVAGAVQATG